MLDNLDRLRNDAHLLRLLGHYARLGEANPEVWHPRLKVMESEEQIDLVKLHGELIAFDYVDQNTGHTPCSYRLTRAGLKALREIENTADDEAGLVIVNQAA